MVKFLFLIFLVIGLAVFVSQNTALVHIQFFLWKSHDFSLAVVILLSAVVGALIAWVAILPAHHRKHRELLRKTKELDDMHERVH